ncbi:MAG: shikimate dehydrogenase [Cyclobacteriaceae bacterium]|jgi:shikimate dehydrogenase
MTKRYGLIGFPLGHSFSKAYFEKKFEQMGISNTYRYDLLELELLKDFPTLWDRYEDLAGVNVTVPHKINIVRFLDRLDSSVHKVEAVNVVKKEGNNLVGYNSDFHGFKQSFINWMKSPGRSAPDRALILGSGGSSKAVQAAMLELGIDFSVVSRRLGQGDLLYTALERDAAIIKDHQLIINTTPLGMFPKLDDAPPIPFDQLSKDHLLYDLVYNPEETVFMKEGKAVGATVKNGMEMLHLQAEKSWEIWND